MQTAKDTLGPHVQSAKDTIQPHLDTVVSAAKPHIDTAAAAAQPYVDTARGKLGITNSNSKYDPNSTVPGQGGDKASNTQIPGTASDSKFD